MHSTSTVLIDSHSSPHSHSKSGRKDVKKLIPHKKFQSTTLENSSPAPLPPVANSNEAFTSGSSDLLINLFL